MVRNRGQAGGSTGRLRREAEHRFLGRQEESKSGALGVEAYARVRLPRVLDEVDGEVRAHPGNRYMHPHPG